MKNWAVRGAIWISILVIMVGCAGGQTRSGGIEVQEAWVRAIGGMGMATPEGGHAMPSGLNSAAYMVIRNSAGEIDRLLRVESDVAAAIELHVSTMENEVMTMRPVENIEIPANGEARLEPGGLHVMLIGVTRSLEPGQTVALNLVFEKAGTIPVEAEIRAP